MPDRFAGVGSWIIAAAIIVVLLIAGTTFIYNGRHTARETTDVAPATGMNSSTNAPPAGHP
jgi:hypothetical protein